MQRIITDWYLIAERFGFNYEALSHGIQDTKEIKSYMSLAHIRKGLKDGYIDQFEDALSVLMNMDVSEAKKYMKQYPDKIDMMYIESKAEKLLESITKSQDLTSTEIRSMAQCVSPIGVIVELLLSKLIEEKRLKEVL